MTVKLERYDADGHVLVEDGKVVAHALLLTSGRWGLFDRDGRRIVPTSYEKPADVAKEFALLAAPAPEPDLP